MNLEDKDIIVSDLMKEQQLQSIVFQTLRQEEEYWRLKSRSLWLHAGDQNTSFFHKKTKARLSNNHIYEITNSRGDRIKGFEKIKEDVEAHLQDLCT